MSFSLCFSFSVRRLAIINIAVIDGFIIDISNEKLYWTRGSHSVMAIIVGNGYDNTSSAPRWGCACISRNTNTLGKDMHLSILLGSPNGAVG